jgi:hypothetical protein
MQAPLGRVQDVGLVLAVTTAGGLGTLGAAYLAPIDLRRQIQAIQRTTEAAFCVNLILAFDQEERVAIVAEEGVPWLSLSWGINGSLIRRAQGAGTRRGSDGHVRGPGRRGDRIDRARSYDRGPVRSDDHVAAQVVGIHTTAVRGQQRPRSYCQKAPPRRNGDCFQDRRLRPLGLPPGRSLAGEGAKRRTARDTVETGSQYSSPSWT